MNDSLMGGIKKAGLRIPVYSEYARVNDCLEHNFYSFNIIVHPSIG